MWENKIIVDPGSIANVTLAFVFTVHLINASCSHLQEKPWVEKI